MNENTSPTARRSPWRRRPRLFSGSPLLRSIRFSRRNRRSSSRSSLRQPLALALRRPRPACAQFRSDCSETPSSLASWLIGFSLNRSSSQPHDGTPADTAASTSALEPPCPGLSTQALKCPRKRGKSQTALPTRPRPRSPKPGRMAKPTQKIAALTCSTGQGSRPHSNPNRTATPTAQQPQPHSKHSPAAPPTARTQPLGAGVPRMN